MWIPASSHFFLGQELNVFHLLLIQLKVENGNIFEDPRFCFGLGQDDKVILKAPAKTYLCDCFFVLACDISHQFIFE